MIALIDDLDVIKKILQHLDLGFSDPRLDQDFEGVAPALPGVQSR